MPKISQLTTYFSAIKARLLCDGLPTARYVPVGHVVISFSPTPATGYLPLTGGSIGNASSSGTARANADCEELFTFLWNACGNTECPVSGGRGASAAADFAAAKRLTLPDARRRFLLGVAATGTGSKSAESGGDWDHKHKTLKHYHEMGAGADLNITSSGVHAHGLSQLLFNPTGGGSVTGSPRTPVDGTSGGIGQSTDNASHIHAAGTIAGRIGIVTGGVDGNADQDTSSNNPPFLTAYWMIAF